MKKDPGIPAQTPSISSIPAYSPSQTPTTSSSRATSGYSWHRSPEQRTPSSMASSSISKHRSFPELQAEVGTLGSHARETFNEFTRGQEKLARSKVKGLKFRSRFPSQAARIDRYTHFDLEHLVKKAGLSRYSHLNKPELLDKYLAYLYGRYRDSRTKDVERVSLILRLLC